VNESKVKIKIKTNEQITKINNENIQTRFANENFRKFHEHNRFKLSKYKKINQPNKQIAH